LTIVIPHRDSAALRLDAEKTSTNMVFMVCHAGGLPVVIRDTAPSMIIIIIIIDVCWT